MKIVGSRTEYQREWARKNPDKVKAKRIQQKLNNPERVKEYQIKYMYGLSGEEYRNMKAIHNNECAICGKAPSGKRTELDVDHDHETKKVRGLLCNNCNRGIGHLQDSVVILEKALNYLKKHKE